MKKNRTDIKQLLKDFNVSTEDELQEKLMNESTMVKCTTENCFNMVNLLNAQFINGDPVCKRCYMEYHSRRDNYDL
jgi:formylmethanofuran dehydrogenase subunit E